MTAIKAGFIAAEKFALPEFTSITNKTMLNLKIYHKQCLTCKNDAITKKHLGSAMTSDKICYNTAKPRIVCHFNTFRRNVCYATLALVHSHFSTLCRSISGYLEQGLLVRDAKKLRQHYFSTSHWRLDIISMLPTDLAYLWWGPNECNFDRVPCAVIVRINRLLRLPRMWEWFERTETATGFPNAFRICKVSVADD